MGAARPAVLEVRQHLTVGLVERHRVVVKAELPADRGDVLGHVAEVAARNAREEVVLDLELQAAVEPVERARAVPVERAAELQDRPRLELRARTPVVHVAGEMARADHGVEQQPGNDAGDQAARDAEAHARDGRQDRGVPREVSKEARQLHERVLLAHKRVRDRVRGLGRLWRVRALLDRRVAPLRRRGT